MLLLFMFMILGLLLRLFLPVYFAHHGFDINWSGGSSSLGLLLLLLLPQDDGMNAWAPAPSILLQLGWTVPETETRQVQVDCVRGQRSEEV